VHGKKHHNKTIEKYTLENKRRMKILCLGTLMLDPYLEPLAF